MSRVRERVLSAARKAAAHRAQGEVSVADVARAAKVSWPTANRHLGGKSGLDELLGAPPVTPDAANTRERLLAAAARCVARSGVDGAPGISQQAFAILPKIGEVDAALTPALQVARQFDQLSDATLTAAILGR